MNSIFLLFALLCVPLCLAQDVEEKKTSIYCTDKSLLNGNALLYPGSDVTLAYNKEASCATLQTTSNENICCYMKIKFENEYLDETFTQKGCIEVDLNHTVDINDDDRFEAFLDTKEAEISKASNVTVDKLSIDCSAKFIKIFTLSLLLFLL